MVSRARRRARYPYLEYTVITEHSSFVAIGFADWVSVIFELKKKVGFIGIRKKSEVKALPVKERILNYRVVKEYNRI